MSSFFGNDRPGVTNRAQRPGVVDRATTTSTNGRCRKAIVAASSAVAMAMAWGFAVGGGRENRRSIDGASLVGGDEFDVEGVDGAHGACVRLPVEVAEGQSGDQARRKELVDIVGIAVLDYGRWYAS